MGVFKKRIIKQSNVEHGIGTLIEIFKFFKTRVDLVQIRVLFFLNLGRYG